MRAWTKMLCVLSLASAAGCSDSSSSKSTASHRLAGPTSADTGSGDGAARFSNSAAPGAPPVASVTPAGMGPSSGAAGAGASFSSPMSSGERADADEGSSEGSAAIPADAEGTPSSEPQPNPQSGTLTAGAWDDNRNFTRFSQYRSDLLQNNLFGALPTTDAEHAAAHDEFVTGPTAHQMLDIALVIDTTGSMGDEITYLQTELVAISSEIAAAYPEAQQRWALVAYKDVGDAYVVQKADFIDNVPMFNQQLALLSAAGGGDTPEAPDAALAEMVALDWRAEADVARLAFWVADAPHHEGNAAAMAEAIRDSHALGVHIYPVASSGIGELTELTMRSSAQLTGGRYLFLTDDSGVGGAHKEPTIPCYFVTRLDRAMTRMVDIEMSGEYHEPAEADIIRTGGDPEDGACTLASGDEVVAY